MTERKAHRILIIDDETAILKMLKIKLSRMGFIADTAKNGEEGIEKINTNEYALILTDIKMPGVSGDQILHYVREKKKSSTPVIGMSGTPWCLANSGFDVILPKPFALKEIENTLKLLLHCI